MSSAIATSTVDTSTTKEGINDNENPTLSNKLIFPFERPSAFEPPIEYARLRAEQPICQVTSSNGEKLWLISRFGDVCLTLADEEHFCKEINQSIHGYLSNSKTVDYSMDRQMIEKEFSIDRMKQIESTIETVVNNFINEFLRENPPVDFISQFAMKIPMLIICDLLGIKSIDYQFLRSRILSHSDRKSSEHQEFIDYLHRLIEQKKQTPQSDLISRLVTEQFQSGRINPKKLIEFISLLLHNGNESIGNQISLGLLSLLQNEDQFKQLHNDPSLIANALEEIIRYHTVVSFATRRSTIKDTTINGQTIKAGEDLLALNASANRDEKVFTHSDRFDITRPPQHHLAFGYGTHQCPAMHFVRTQLKIIFTSLIQRLPTLRLAQSIDEIEFVTDSNEDMGVKQMLVKW